MAGDRAECARLQKELQARLVEVRGEVGVERERMEAQYDCLLRRQEGELRARVAELTTSLVEKEGLLRELGKELQAAKTAAECVRREAEEKAEEAAKMEQGHRTKERELLEQLSAQGLKVVDLETLLASSESRLKGLQGEAARKLAELDRSLREKDRALTATKEVCAFSTWVRAAPVEAPPPITSLHTHTRALTCTRTHALTCTHTHTRTHMHTCTQSFRLIASWSVIWRRHKMPSKGSWKRWWRPAGMSSRCTVPRWRRRGRKLGGVCLDKRQERCTILTCRVHFLCC